MEKKQAEEEMVQQPQSRVYVAEAEVGTEVEVKIGMKTEAKVDTPDNCL